MPSETFFRLPEEKRTRLMDAAWDEFTKVRLADVSINKIIRAARIPRGSFYQYFADKHDLFDYLVRPLQQHFFALAREEVERSDGDLSRSIMAIYDRFFAAGAPSNFALKRCIQIVRCNPDSEFHTLFCAPDSPLSGIIGLVDTSQLRRQDADFVREVFHLFIFTIASAIIDTLNRPEERETIRRQLELRAEILLRGCAPANQGGTQ